MRKVKEVIDKSTPYRNLGATMIKAPIKATSEPKAVSTKGKEDLRAKGGK